MQSDFESSAWADNHRATSDAIGAAVDKLGYIVTSIVSRRRADERRAQRLSEFGY